MEDNEKYRLFIDMDGTLAEWRNFKYELTSFEDVQNVRNMIYQKLNVENYFYNLKPQENIVNAVRNIVQNHNDSIDIYILSASISDVATNDKNRWLDRYLPEIDKEHRIFTKDGEDKRNFITGGVKENDYLLDDRTLNLMQWQQTGKGIKLLNGQNHTAKTWKGDMISYDNNPQVIAKKIVSLINENVHVQDKQPFHTEQTITIKPITVNAFENTEVWEAERKALKEQYLKIIRDKNFRALEWYTDMGSHYIFHPSVKSGDWQLSFIDNKGIPTSDSQYKDEDIGTGRRWIDPIAELPHSRPDKTITIKALFENPNRERGNMVEQESSIDNYIEVMQTKQLYPRFAVLQLAEGDNDTHHKRYESLNYLNERGEKPNGDDYEMIYFNVNDPNETKINLDEVFAKFTADEPRPSNYYGHSLSVSDVVLVSENGTDVKAYYCDRYGFNELDNNFITPKIKIRFNTGTTLREEYNLLLEKQADLKNNEEYSNETQSVRERVNYISEEYSPIFTMAEKRAVLEENEKLNAIFDYEMLYGGIQNVDSITVYNEQLDRVMLNSNVFNNNSSIAIHRMVNRKYFEALADRDLHNENLTYDNLASFQERDIVSLGNGHTVVIKETQVVEHEDLPFPRKYNAEYDPNDSNYFDPEFPNQTPETSFFLSDVDYVQRGGVNIIEPPIEEVQNEQAHENLPFDVQSYKYYSTQRPISFGTYPNGNDLFIENYDRKIFIEKIGREAWGEITYSQPLTEKQISDYELTADVDDLVNDESIRGVTHGEGDVKEIEKNLLMNEHDKRMADILAINSKYNYNAIETELMAREFAKVDLPVNANFRDYTLNELWEVVYKNYTLQERYTEAMRIAGYELAETDSMATVTFEIENSDGKMGFDSWQLVGQYLEDVVLTDETKAKRFDELIHPQNRIQFVTQNLDGEDLIDESEIDVYQDLKTALKAYLDANVVDGKAIGFRMDGQNPSLHAINFAHFDTVDMRSHMHNLPNIKFLIPNATVNELEQIEDIYKTVSDEIERNNNYIKLEQKSSKLADMIYNFYRDSDEAETDSLELIKSELHADNGKQYREDIYDYLQEHFFELSDVEISNALEIITDIDNGLENLEITEFKQSKSSLNETLKDLMQTLVDSDLENNGIISKDTQKVLEVQKFILDDDNKVVGITTLPHREEDFSITLHIKYKEPVVINGWKAETDTITFSNIEEFDKFINGEKAFDAMDNAITLKENELLQFAVDSNGESVVWNAEDENELELKLHDKIYYKSATITEESYNSYAIDNSFGVRSAYFETLEKAKQAVDEVDKSNGIPHIKGAELVRSIRGIEFYAKEDNPTLVMTYNENYNIEVGEDLHKACERIFDNYYKEEYQENLNAQKKEWVKLSSSVAEENPINTEKEINNMAEKITEKDELSAKDQVMKQLEDGIKGILDSENFADWCKKQGRLYYNNYSFRNAILTYLQKPDATYVSGYEAWKEYGRQVKKGAKGIKILAPSFVKEYGAKGSLLTSIKKSCSEQFKKDNNLEYATFLLGQSKLSFIMYKNGLFDVKVGDDVRMAHITSDEMRKFLDQSVIGKIPAYYNAITVFDVADTTNDVEFIWLKSGYKTDELVLDDTGNPIKNNKGQFKIINSEERKARFNSDLSLTIQDSDNDKMEILFDTLKTLSEKKGIPFEISDPSKDDTLANGALGYYRRPQDGKGRGNIVISSDLSITNQVSVAFHEIAHSDLHFDVDWLKDEMDLDAGERVTREMKETQAEAVALMTANNFGIETEHKSFNYIAHWSDGRDLRSLEQSLDIIYKESKKLMNDIEKELDTRGLTLSLEVKDKTPLSADQKLSLVTDYKKFILSELRSNETLQKSALEDFKSTTDDTQKEVVKEQIVLTHKVDEKLTELNNRVEQFEKSTDRYEQVCLQYKMKADMNKVKSFQKYIDDLSEERVNIVLEHLAKEKNDLKSLYTSNPIKAMEQLQKQYSQMKDLSHNDLKYLSVSKYVSREFSKYIGINNEKFIDLAIKQLSNLKEVMSKNSTAVEISFCEQWSDKPIFVSGSVAHPKVANKVISQAEKQIESFKLKAEKENDYYPYSRCNLTVYSLIDNEKLVALNTRIDIGDKEQKDLTDHLSQICKRGKDKHAVFDNFSLSVKEKPVLKILTPYLVEDKDTESVRGGDEAEHDNRTMSMNDWKSEMKDPLKNLETNVHVQENTKERE